MAKTKVTVTLDEVDLRSIRDLVAARKASSVSGFVQHAINVALLDMGGWARSLEQALEETGGPLTSKERAWADGVLGRAPQARRRRGRAA